MTELRINARLDDKAANDLEFLKGSTNATNTEALKAALHFYAEHLRNDVQRGKQALLDSGFIGCFEGPEDLSSNHKNYVKEAIDAKYPPQKPDHR